MKLLVPLFICVLFAILPACSGPVAHNETPADAGEGVAADASPRAQLEQSLEKLNRAITETPSTLHHQRAEVLFRLDRFEEAAEDYATASRSGWPHDEDSCWERGLAQYYAGDFSGGREQFARYHRVGSTDIENGIWRFLCIAEEEGVAKARETMLAYPEKDRKPFPALLALYLDKGSADAVLKEAASGAPSEEQLTVNLFNAHYYLGKYYEILDQKDLALTHVREALEYEYAHFMYACAEADARRLEALQGPKAAEQKP